jgi:hypothetical protein
MDLSKGFITSDYKEVNSIVDFKLKLMIISDNKL